MPRFMSDRFGHVRRGAAQGAGEYAAHIGRAVIKAAYIRHATGGYTVPVAIRAADGHLGYDLVGQHARVNRCDVYVEWGVVFSHSGPDLIDGGQLTAAERRLIAILVEGGS